MSLEDAKQDVDRAFRGDLKGAAFENTFGGAHVVFAAALFQGSERG